MDAIYLAPTHQIAQSFGEPDREVIYPCAKVCKLHAGEDCTAGVEEYLLRVPTQLQNASDTSNPLTSPSFPGRLWQWQSKHHEGYFRQTDYQQHLGKHESRLMWWW